MYLQSRVVRNGRVGLSEPNRKATWTRISGGREDSNGYQLNTKRSKAMGLLSLVRMLSSLSEEPMDLWKRQQRNASLCGNLHIYSPIKVKSMILIRFGRYLWLNEVELLGCCNMGPFWYIFFKCVLLPRRYVSLWQDSEPRAILKLQVINVS